MGLGLRLRIPVDGLDSVLSSLRKVWMGDIGEGFKAYCIDLRAANAGVCGKENKSEI